MWVKKARILQRVPNVKYLWMIMLKPKRIPCSAMSWLSQRFLVWVLFKKWALNCILAKCIGRIVAGSLYREYNPRTFRVTRQQHGLKNAAANFQQVVAEMLKGLTTCIVDHNHTLQYGVTDTELRKKDAVRAELKSEQLAVKEEFSAFFTKTLFSWDTKTHRMINPIRNTPTNNFTATTQECEICRILFRVNQMLR